MNKQTEGFLRRHRFTLLEALVYVSVLMLILTGSVKVFHAASKYSRTAMEHSQRFDALRLTHEQWKRTVHPSDPGTWTVQENSFHIGTDVSVVRRGNQLVFLDSGKPVKRLRLKPDTEITFHIESDTNPATAVLTVSWPSQRIADRGRESVRLAACARGKPAPEPVDPAGVTKAK